MKKEKKHTMETIAGGNTFSCFTIPFHFTTNMFFYYYDDSLFFSLAQAKLKDQQPNINMDTRSYLSRSTQTSLAQPAALSDQRHNLPSMS